MIGDHKSFTCTLPSTHKASNFPTINPLKMRNLAVTEVSKFGQRVQNLLPLWKGLIFSFTP